MSTELNHFVWFQRNGGDDARANIGAAPAFLPAPELEADPEVGVFHVDVGGALAAALRIKVLNQRFRRDQSPRAFQETRQLTLFNGRETHQHPRIVSVVIRYEECARCRLHHNLPIEKVRAKYEAVDALMYAREQLAAYFEGRGPV